MKNAKLGFASIALVILVVIILGGVGYWAWQGKAPNSSRIILDAKPAYPPGFTPPTIPPPTNNSSNTASVELGAIQNWPVYSDGSGNALYKYPPSWTVKNFYYIGSRYPERYDPQELPSGVDFQLPEGDAKDRISLGIRVSMDPAKCGQYPREKATKCITSNLIVFGGSGNSKGGGIMWTESSNPEVLQAFDLIAKTLLPAPSATDTSKWKTYINTKYSFEFKYPAEAILESDNKLETMQETDIILLPQVATGNLYLTKRLRVAAYDSGAVLNPCVVTSGQPPLVTQNVNGEIFRKFSGGNLASRGSTGRRFSYQLFRDTGCFVVGLDVWKSQIDEKSDFEILDQILSTFRFTK